MPERTSPVGRWVGFGGSCSDTPTQELGCCWLPSMWPENPTSQASRRSPPQAPGSGVLQRDPSALSLAGRRPAGH